MLRLITTLCLMVLCFSKNFEAFAQITPPQTDEQIQREQLKKAVKEALNNFQKKKTATQEAEDFYQFETNDKPCTHCPQYLNLIREVNHIVEKLPAKESESVAVQNESLIQLNRLKFMYYERRVSEENGNGLKCIEYQHSDILNKQVVNDENSFVLAEEALSLPNVTTIQLIPEGKDKEIHYYYRGTGGNSNVVVEVVIYPDRKAVIRYRRMKESNGMNLPDLGSTPRENAALTDFQKSLVNLGASLSLSKEDRKNVPETIVSQDIKIAEDNGTVALGDGLNLKSNGKAKLNNQTVGVALNDGTRDIVKVDVQHKTLKNLEVTTVVPLSWKMEGGLTVGGAVSFDAKKEFSGDLLQTKSVVLGLTDHNNEYIKTSLVQRNNINEVSLSSRYKLSGDMGSVSGTAVSDSTGRKEFKLSHGITDSSTSMTTSVGMTADAKRFFELQREQKIGKTQTMVLTIRTDDSHQTTIMYQYRLSLK